MGKVTTEFTMSLDGFIAGPNDDVGTLFRWYFSGDTDFQSSSNDPVFKISRASAELLRKQWDRLGAIVTGRGDFEASEAWGGNSPLGLPIFIVTHTPPQEWVHDGSPFTFVTGGVERAIERAKQAVGDKDVAVSGSTIVQQCLQAGLLDEIQIDLAPVLLGAGIRLFDHLGESIELEKIKVVDAPDVTHLRFRVVRERSS
jgi:dihydrofolate reductase